MFGICETIYNCFDFGVLRGDSLIFFFLAIIYVIWPLSVLGLILMSVSFKVLFVIYLSCYCGIILESLGK